MTARRYPPRSSALYDPATEMPRPVVGLDIDGTLGEYHLHFLRFAEGWFGSPMPGVSIYKGEKYDGKLPLYRWMGVSKARYRQCKMAYRRGGLKRSMPVREGAAELSRAVRAAGATVIICTTRPFLMLENVDPDTQEWLRRNRIQYDGILHGEHKYRDLARAYGNRIVMVLEDIPELLTQAQENACHPVLIRRPHNSGYASEFAVYDLQGAQEVALRRIADYEKRNR